MKNFVGIEIRNVQVGPDDYTSIYVDKEAIEFSYPDTDFTDENKVFFQACEYLETYGKNVVSCEHAKVNEIYCSK
jgi:hypothetical protein